MSNDRETLQTSDEQRIADMVKQYHASIEIPDGEQAWLQMRSTLQAARKRRRVFRVSAIGAAIACFSILIGLSFGAMDQTYAFSGFSTIFKKVQNGFVSIMFDTSPAHKNGAKTAPPPDYDLNTGKPYADQSGAQGNQPDHSYAGNAVTPETSSFETAGKKVNFAMLVPTYTPDGLTLESVNIYRDADGAYRSMDAIYSYDGEQRLLLIQQKIEQGGEASVSINQASGEIKDVNIHGNQAVLVLYAGGGANLEWIAGDTRITLTGSLDEQELMKFARSLQ